MKISLLFADDSPVFYNSLSNAGNSVNCYVLHMNCVKSDALKVLKEKCDVEI